MHPYAIEILQRTHADDLRREAEWEQRVDQLPCQPGIQHWLAAQAGLLLIRGGKRLTLYGYAKPRCA